MVRLLKSFCLLGTHIKTLTIELIYPRLAANHPVRKGGVGCNR